MEISFWAKTILIIGVIFIIIGLVMMFLPKITIFQRLGRLPGDIIIKRGNVTFYFPWVTCIIISIILTFIFSILRR
ncbi:MAG: DUF2905 domain-containing protein [Candidatus Atribacteria bacterium]|nr:DUF2905 domain-containing protein [Candidatus Atribacteria bacterium]